MRVHLSHLAQRTRHATREAQRNTHPNPDLCVAERRRYEDLVAATAAVSLATASLAAAAASHAAAAASLAAAARQLRQLLLPSASFVLRKQLVVLFLLQHVQLHFGRSMRRWWARFRV